MDPELMAAFLPTLRSDLRLLEDYAYLPEERLDCALTILGGRDDRWATNERLSAWIEHAASVRGPLLFPGGHFYVRDARAEVVATVARSLVATSVAAAPAAPW
jgi:medium-chain acyl-[acyl-carrier-protein] hydrolase